MSRLDAADELQKSKTSEIYDDSSTDSEIRDQQIEKTLRESRLAGIAWHRHVHECHKALGIPTDETPLSVVPETEFEPPLSSSDEGFWAPSVSSSGGGHGDGETATVMEDDGGKETFRPGVEGMLRILLPRYFDLVRSFLILMCIRCEGSIYIVLFVLVSFPLSNLHDKLREFLPR